ncbi:FixH family protein [Chitinophaga nivalis]|uniref:FixH family protein n=1 Tax=Chitinophaga nivalis TaxID=2991709 RepID=A0ABT3IV22_9BACT|nr:FixH family protein [Chitinophaga nivalis]MCW3462467.1 FixH family protein [Chitinophaga nivalis]MCW3487842.1 FixH family protein [Chitinophaga nivalis]
MHWGHKIILVFVVFAAGMLTLVTKSMRTKIDMVTPDYYSEELKYQQIIDGQQHAAALSAPVVISQPDDHVAVSFPAELHGRSFTGKITFYRPSDSGKDVILPLQTNTEGQQLISKSLLTKGNYKIKLQWEMDGKPFYQEQSLHIH